MFNVVLVEPEIPPNTGNIGRLCLATGSCLHLVQPLGFTLDDRQLKRAGLDYWQEVKLVTHASLADFLAAVASERLWLISTKGKRSYTGVQFHPNDYLIFGRETKGLPEPLLHAMPEQVLRIPMQAAGARSLNLAVAAGIVVYEAWRQCSFQSAWTSDSA